MSIYDTLNPEQKEAVLHTEGPLLILAGAGSGKTRVLIHRVAWLMEQGVNPWNIMAITFTNKAAGEMRERVDKLVGMGSESVWVTTFHSTCVRILRRHIEHLGFGTSFSIYDGDDQKTVMKEVCKRLQIDTKIIKERSLLAARILRSCGPLPAEDVKKLGGPADASALMGRNPMGWFQRTAGPDGRKYLYSVSEKGMEALEEYGDLLA